MIKLYEHNQQAYDSALSLMDETGKAALIHPTGTGKSFIGFKLAEEHPDHQRKPKQEKVCKEHTADFVYE